jgi:hypothetical protein
MGFLKLARQSRTASPNHRFVIALHSPEEVFETGLVGCPPEKSAAKCTGAIEHATFSVPPLIGKVEELRLFRAISRAIRTDFSALRTAWRRGRDSNPPVRFWHAKPRHIRKLQIANPYQRISRQPPRESFAISPVSIRRPFAAEWRTPRDSVAESGQLKTAVMTESATE